MAFSQAFGNCKSCELCLVELSLYMCRNPSDAGFNCRPSVSFEREHRHLRLALRIWLAAYFGMIWTHEPPASNPRPGCSVGNSFEGCFMFCVVTELSRCQLAKWALSFVWRCPRSRHGVCRLVWLLNEQRSRADCMRAR